MLNFTVQELTGLAKELQQQVTSCKQSKEGDSACIPASLTWTCLALFLTLLVVEVARLIWIRRYGAEVFLLDM